MTDGGMTNGLGATWDGVGATGDGVGAAWDGIGATGGGVGSASVTRFIVSAVIALD